ncbi:MAG: 4-alpha-glucanotransferase, partial [Acidobacteria bacterium]|nr:4-alpha-glucanotransferase [Acidobacteriota bacterium]
MKFPRASGILLHPTSLPGEFGIGDLGPQARGFVDRLAAAKQTYWQILPLGPTGWGDSPYSCYSAFAGNTLLISPEHLAEQGLISREDLEAKPSFPSDKVDYGMAYEWKMALLQRAFAHYRTGNFAALRNEAGAFATENAWWLNDYALFRAIKSAHGGSWQDWDESQKMRDPDQMAVARSELAEQIGFEVFAQFLFFRQWSGLKAYANENGIRIIGDIPIFVAMDSADVWCNRDIFKLNDDGSAKVVAGVPPDYFSATGQLWGNPIYDWDELKKRGFDWWIARVMSALKLVDVLRLDHFIGFTRNWEVPAGEQTAENGEWCDVPGPELFAKMKEAAPDMPFIVEDLGAVTDEVIKLRDDNGLPGMKILQNGFNGDARSGDLPHNYPVNSVAYTGTHDNNTSVGWYKSIDKDKRIFCRKY